MNIKNAIPDELLDKIGGGTLPEGWETIVDSYYPQYAALYPNYSYDEACTELRKYITDENDANQICQYIKKFF